MAQLFIPMQGAFQKASGSGYNTYGESFERSHWRGAEIGLLDKFPDVWGATGEVEFRDWVMGVHHPLFKEGGPEWCHFFHRDPEVRAKALELAYTSAQAAHHIGARYILFHFPWPAFVDDAGEYVRHGWYFPPRTERLEDWSEAEVYDVSRRAFERFAEIQSKELIKIVLEIDGPNPFFFDGEMYSRLFEVYPDLSLCIDTGRLGLLARTHGKDPLELCRRWLPWARHMHLCTSRWDEQGRYRNHIPTTAAHTMAAWPEITPAADMARMIVEAQPRCTIVLEHDPKAVSPEELEEAHAFAARLVGLES